MRVLGERKPSNSCAVAISHASDSHAIPNSTIQESDDDFATAAAVTAASLPDPVACLFAFLDAGYHQPAGSLPCRRMAEPLPELRRDHHLLLPEFSGPNGVVAVTDTKQTGIAALPPANRCSPEPPPCTIPSAARNRVLPVCLGKNFAGSFIDAAIIVSGSLPAIACRRRSGPIRGETGHPPPSASCDEGP